MTCLCRPVGAVTGAICDARCLALPAARRQCIARPSDGFYMRSNSIENSGGGGNRPKILYFNPEGACGKCVDE